MTEKKKKPPEHKTRVSARVTLTIEVMSEGQWPGNVDFDEVYPVAVRDVENRIRRMTEGKATIVGKPKVAAILIENND